MHSPLTQNFMTVSIRRQTQINTTVLPLKLITKTGGTQVFAKLITETGGTQVFAKGENISNLDDTFHVYINYSLGCTVLILKHELYIVSHF